MATFRETSLSCIGVTMISFFLQILRLYATLWVMTDLERLYVDALAWS